MGQSWHAVYVHMHIQCLASLLHIVEARMVLSSRNISPSIQWGVSPTYNSSVRARVRVRVRVRAYARGTCRCVELHRFTSGVEIFDLPHAPSWYFCACVKAWRL
jgi:hypothetical protein